MSGLVPNQDTDSPCSSAQKKSSLDDLSREDLLKKCRSLLAISQKAKQAKDDAVEEVKSTKHELNIRIQESSALQAEVEKLKQLVRTISDEKESVLTAIENVKSNNHELQNLVRSISAERDAFFRDITELNGEKKKLVAVVDMMGIENDGTLAEVRSLKDDKRKLNDELFAAISDREIFETEIKEVKLKMVYLLNNSYSLVKKFHIDVVSSEDSPMETGKTYTGVVCDLIAKLEKNLLLIDSNDGKTNNKAQDNESNQKYAELQSKLNSEINEQKNVILNLESHIQSLETVNIGMEEEVKTLKSHSNELQANALSDNKQREELMKELQESRDRFTKAKQEMDHLRDEIGVLMESNKKQSFNAMEMKGVKNENQVMKAAISEQESVIASLREELESNRKTFALQITSLEKAIADREEKISVLHKQHEAIQQELSEVNDKLSKSNVDSIMTLECDNKIKFILSELKSEISNARKSFEEKEIEVSQSKKQIQELEISVTNAKNEIAILESLIRDKEVEISKNEELSAELAELTRVVEAKEQELGELREANKTHEGVEGKFARLHSELQDVKTNSERKISQMAAVIEEHVKASKELKLELDVKESELKAAMNEKREQEEGKMEMLTAMTRLDEELQVKVSESEEMKSAHFKEVEELRNSISQLSESKLKLTNALKKLEEEGIPESSIAILNLERELESKQLEIDNIHSTFKKEVMGLQKSHKQLEENKQDLIISLKKLGEKSNLEALAATKLNDELKTNFSELENMQSALKKELEALKSSNKALAENKLELAGALKKYESDTVEMHSTLEKVETELKATKSELERVRSDLANEVEMVQNLKQEHESLINELTLDYQKQVEDCKSASLTAISLMEGELKTKVLDNMNKVEEIQNVFRTIEVDKSALLNDKKQLEDLLEKKSNELEEILSTGEKESQDMSAKIAELQRINTSRLSEIETLTSELQQSRANLKTMERDFSEQLRSADERDREERERLSDDLVNVQNTSAETMATLNAVNMELEALKASQANVEKNGHQELLAEMNDMNQVLKQRGETISKQRELIKELELKYKESEKAAAAALQDHERKMAELKNELANLTAVQLRADESEKELTEEINKLRNKVSQLERDIREHGDTASEAMSCSTISRAEESTRLVDMEDSFEERYTKLRVIAVRLKKKCSELTQQVAGLETERNKLASDAHNKATQLSSQAKHLQSIQQEYDRAQDLHDARAKELKAALKLSEEASNDAASLKICTEQLKIEKEELLKDLELSTTSKLALETQIQSLQSQSQSWRKEKTEWESQVERLKEEVRSAEQRAKDEKTRHGKTAEELAAKKQQAKADSVLCLEIANYERTLAELSASLSAEKAKAAELRGHADSQRDIHRGLQEQIRLMAESLEEEGARCAESNEQLSVLRSRLAEASSQLSDRDAEIAALKSSVEARRFDAETAQVEMARLAGEGHEREAEFRDKVARLTQQVRLLEDQLSEKSTELVEVSQQLQSTTADFEGYKVRAQSVLRAKHRPEEASDCEEVAQLRRAADSSRARLNEISGQLESATSEAASLRTERDRLAAKCRDLAAALTAAESRCAALADQLRDESARHREALAAQKIHADILAQGMRAQNEGLVQEAAAEKLRLEDQIVLLESRLAAEKNRVSRSEDRSRSVRDEKTSTNSSGSIRRVSPEHLVQLVREEGEGSESVDSSSPHLSASDRHELMPLDKLLAGEADQEIAAPGVRHSSEAEATRLRHEASLSERRLRHVTAVLAEAERDRDRLEQLNTALKEEIRRSRRSDEREQHAHNHEYLKNVVLKFVTLQGGDERSRLVPVLNTILRLSPEEANHLTAVAKGDQVGGVKGWGSFLWQ